MNRRIEAVLALVLAMCALCARDCAGGELTFELPDNEKQCFYEEVKMGEKSTLEFQVVTGGHYDVDCEVYDPDNKELYREFKKQYDTFTWTAAKAGIHKICFSNEFSTFTHKVVYFDLTVGEEKPLMPSMEAQATAMTQLESAAVQIHEALKVTTDYQTHFRLRESQGRSFAEDLNEKVMLWSIGESLMILVIGISQILILRSFFSDKKTIPGI